VHHCEELVETIKTDILFAIFGARNKKILNPRRNLRGKTLEDSRRQITEAEPKGFPCGAGWPDPHTGQHVGPTGHPLLRTSAPHHLLGCIYAVLQVV
jgi:hypothetical protein